MDKCAQETVDASGAPADVVFVKWMTRLTDAAGLRDMPALRKTIVAIIGTTIVLFGLALIVLPGPAVVVIPLGLAILAGEFAWARRAIRRARVLIAKARGVDRRSRARSEAVHAE